MNKPVITGMGAVTPIGIGVEEYWNALKAGKTGAGPITSLPAGNLPVRIAAEVSSFTSGMPRSLMRSASLFMQYAFAAASEALSQSQVLEHYPPARIGICMGTALAGVSELAARTLEFSQSSTGKASPHLVPRILPNMAVCEVAIHYNIKGPGLTTSTACSAGSDALIAAAMLLATDEADAVLVMGAESILSPVIISSLSQARALSRRNDAPQTACRPFDGQRDGFVIGEGGGALILEKEGSPARGLARLAGWGNTLDGWHITAPEPNGEGAARCMREALKRAGLAPTDIDYINAHGTGTLLGDLAETRALKAVFGPNVPPVSSTKGATGHLMGAGGLTEAIACILAMRDNILPPTLNLEFPDPECDLDYVPRVARPAEIRAAMSNSLGFGGQNSSIVLTKIHE